MVVTPLILLSSITYGEMSRRDEALKTISVTFEPALKNVLSTLKKFQHESENKAKEIDGKKYSEIAPQEAFNLPGNGTSGIRYVSSDSEEERLLADSDGFLKNHFGVLDSLSADQLEKFYNFQCDLLKFTNMYYNRREYWGQLTHESTSKCQNIIANMLLRNTDLTPKVNYCLSNPPADENDKTKALLKDPTDNQAAVFNDLIKVFSTLFEFYKISYNETLYVAKKLYELNSEGEKNTNELNSLTKDVAEAANKAFSLYRDIFSASKSNTNRFARQEGNLIRWRFNEGVKLQEIHADRIALNNIFRAYLTKMKIVAEKSRYEMKKMVDQLKSSYNVVAFAGEFQKRYDFHYKLANAVKVCMDSLKVLSVDFMDEEAMIAFAMALSEFNQN